MNKMILSKPLIISFEGIDGTFKNTNAEALKKYIKKNYTDKVVLFSFPNYDSDSSYLVQSYFRNIKKYNELSPLETSRLFILDMYDTWYKKIQKYYEDNYIIIIDRFWLSNIYYQGTVYINNSDIDKHNDVARLNKYLEFSRSLIDMNNEVYKLPEPDLVYIMHNKLGNEDIINKRLNEDEGHNGEINESDVPFLYQVQANLFKYKFLNNSCDTKTIELVKDVYLRTRDDIAEEVYTSFDEFIRG